jgi:hypothetical protein
MTATIPPGEMPELWATDLGQDLIATCRSAHWYDRLKKEMSALISFRWRIPAPLDS